MTSFTAEQKLEFLKSKGLHVTVAKTSDKPEPYLVYVIDEDSEFDDTNTIIKLTDAEIFKKHVENRLIELGFNGKAWCVPTKTLFNALCDRFIGMKAEITALKKG